MKKRTMLFALAVLAGLCTTEVYAGSIDYLSNQSAEYIRTFSRNASTDADAVHYNPAGTAFMGDGIYFYLSNMSIFKQYTSTLDYAPVSALGYNKDYKSTYPSYFVPNFYAIYKKDNWAGMLGAGVIAGGGTLKYDDGIPMMPMNATNVATAAGVAFAVWTKGNLEATSYYPYISLGGAYKITDMISLSLSGRFVYATKSYKGSSTYSLHSGYPPTTGNYLTSTTLELDATEKATGFGGLFGVDIKPMSNLLVGLKIETPTILSFKTTVNDNKGFGTGAASLFKDGYTRRKDLPAVLTLGASYAPIEQLTITTSVDMYGIGLFGQDTYDDTATSDIYAEDGYNKEFDKVGWEASLSVEYAIMPKFLAASIGYMYDKVGGNEKTYNDFDYSLDSQTVCGGVKVTPMENLDVSLGVSRTMYKESEGFYNKTYDTNFAKYDRLVHTVALGVQYKL